MNKNKKQCSKCQEMKRLEEFYDDQKSQDGLQSQCNSCKRIRNDRHADKAIAHFPEMVMSKSDHETVAALPMGAVVKIDRRKVLIEKVKVKKSGQEIVVLKILNKEGAKIDNRFKPFTLDKRIFIDALNNRGRVRLAA